MRRSRRVVSRAGGLCEHEFLLRKRVVRKRAIPLPDLVQDRQLGAGVLAEVADEFTHVSPDLLLDMGAVVGVPSPRTGGNDLVVQAVSVGVLVDRLELGKSMPMVGNGNTACTSMRASNTPFVALLRTNRVTAHPVTMSVIVKVKQCSPDALPPSSALTARPTPRCETPHHHGAAAAPTSVASGPAVSPTEPAIPRSISPKPP